MSKEQRLIDVNAIPENATAISTDGRLFVAWSAIVEAPTVDAVEVVHGRWVEIPSLLDLPWKKYRCDYCGCPQDYKHNYCPNCGAKMDGGINK